MNTVSRTTLHPSLRRSLPWLAFALLLAGCIVVLWSFAAAIIWATVLAYVTWPVYRWGRHRLRGGQVLAPTLMTTLVVLAIVMPIAWLVMVVHAELVGAYHALAAWLPRALRSLPGDVREIPLLGTALGAALSANLDELQVSGPQLAAWLQRLAGPTMSLLGGMVRSAGEIGVALVVLFFLYRDGERLAAQAARVVRHLRAERLAPFVTAAGAMTRAVIVGVLVSALAQGLVAGVGYRIAGVQASVLLAALTAMLAIVPVFGTSLVWLPLAAWLVVRGEIWQAVFTLAWGALVVNPTNNLLEPLLISSSARAPFAVVFLGVLGGIAAFGLVGIVIGPVLLGTALVLWRQLSTERAGCEL